MEEDKALKETKILIGILVISITCIVIAFCEASKKSDRTKLEFQQIQNQLEIVRLNKDSEDTKSWRERESAIAIKAMELGYTQVNGAWVKGEK